MDEQGEIRHYVSIKQDISLRKQNQAELEGYRDRLELLVDERTNELREAREEAERLSEVKGAFLANMSHEIRTPMNAVLGFCYLLEQFPLEDEARKLVNKIHGAGRSLLAIINDILDFSKIEAGRLEIEHQPFRLSDILDDLAALMESAARQKNLELVITPPVDTDALIGDGLRLQQVLMNLLSNAIKFTDRGEVELRISVNSRQGQQLKLRFAVCDTGIGISADQQTDIFSAFTQADSTISRRFGGTGLGLAISQQLVQLMGGKLQVESRLGRGSEFSFVLPLESGLHADTKPVSIVSLNLLIADDSYTSRRALLNTANSLGWKADVVYSGETAVSQALARWLDQEPYDVILLDWKMPGQDGLATAEAIHKAVRQTGDEHKKQPIVIMVTAYTREQLMAEPGLAYVDTILSKPVTPSALYNAITEVFSRRLPGSVSLPVKPFAVPIRRLAGIRVLVVDDSEINREVAKCILEADGATVIPVNDGQEAVDYLRADRQSVDIVLMDLQMPNMDGYTATHLIRQELGLEKLPIVALTAGAFQSLRDAAYAAGMDDFIAKPFNVEQLVSLIQRFTGNSSGISREETNPAEESGLLPSTAATRLAEDKLPGIDSRQGLTQWGNERQYLVYLLKFADSFANAGLLISNFIDSGDPDAAKALVHKLKGVAGNLALKSVAEKASELDELLHKNLTATNAIDSLHQALSEACASIMCLASAGDQYVSYQKPVTAIDNLESVLDLLGQLSTALDEDSPSVIEPILLQINGKIPVNIFDSIEAQVKNFDFRGAEATTLAFIGELKTQKTLFEE